MGIVTKIWENGLFSKAKDKLYMWGTSLAQSLSHVLTHLHGNVHKHVALLDNSCSLILFLSGTLQLKIKNKEKSCNLDVSTQKFEISSIFEF